MKRVAWVEDYEASSSSADEEVEPETPTEDNDDSTKEETVPDNGPYNSSGLIYNTTGLRANPINANPGLTLNGRGGPAHHDQEYGWYKLLFCVFPLIIIWFFWKNSRYRHISPLMRRRQKGHRVSNMKSHRVIKIV